MSMHLMNRCLIGVYLTGVHLTGVNLKGVYLSRAGCLEVPALPISACWYLECRQQ
jgi:hypothetical protein